MRVCVCAKLLSVSTQFHSSHTNLSTVGLRRRVRRAGERDVSDVTGSGVGRVGSGRDLGWDVAR